MRRARGGLAVFPLLMLMMLFIGVGNLIRYADHGRFVDFVGISGGGATLGAGLAGLVGWYLVFTGNLRLADRQPAEEQPSVPVTRTHRSQS